MLILRHYRQVLNVWYYFTIDGSQVKVAPLTIPVAKSASNHCSKLTLLTVAYLIKKVSLWALEVYKKDGIWRVSAVGQGFNGGAQLP